PAVVADGLAELQISFPNVAIVFCQTRKLAQEYTYRYRAAAHKWVADSRDTATVFGADAARLPLQLSPSRIPPTCVCGPIALACLSRIAVGCGQRFGRPGTTPIAA